MIARTLRLLPMATGLAMMLVLGADARALATAIHPAVSCGEPCDPVGPTTILILIVGIEHFLSEL